MPFYEYECAKCGYHDEVLQMIGEKPLTKCPSCGKSGLKKLVSAPVFRLKGSGWYETDFKSDKENKRNLAGADKEDSKPDAKEVKADSNADAKVESKPSDTKSSEPKPASAKPAPVKTAARKPAKSKPAAKSRTGARR